MFETHGSGSQDPFGGFAQRVHSPERRGGLLLAVAMVDENGLAAGPMPGLDIAPAVADNEAGAEIDVPRAGGLGEQARLRLAARALLAVVVRAHADVIQL